MIKFISLLRVSYVLFIVINFKRVLIFFSIYLTLIFLKRVFEFLTNLGFVDIIKNAF